MNNGNSPPEKGKDWAWWGISRAYMKLGCHVWIYVRVAKTGDSTGNDWVYFGFGRFLSFCFNGLKDPPRGAIIVSWISQRTSVGARSEYFFSSFVSIYI